MHLNTWTVNNKYFVYIIETGICAESYSLFWATIKAWLKSKIEYLKSSI